MKFTDFIKLLGQQDSFDLAMVVQLFDIKRNTALQQLSRWAANGQILLLKRGIYTLNKDYRKDPFNPAVVANQLCHPSYLGGLWAMAFHGLIPEGVSSFTSITTKFPQRHSNKVGTFIYHHLKQEYFFGYTKYKFSGKMVSISTPEKALLDYFYLNPGEWSYQRIEQMRFQSLEILNLELLQEYTDRFDKPKLFRVTKKLKEFIAQHQYEGVEI
jgi:predicted transcriptional regulator of viral defense system